MADDLRMNRLLADEVDVCLDLLPVLREMVMMYASYSRGDVLIHLFAENYRGFEIPVVAKDGKLQVTRIRLPAACRHSTGWPLLAYSNRIKVLTEHGLWCDGREQSADDAATYISDDMPTRRWSLKHFYPGAWQRNGRLPSCVADDA
jgi:hypothetical protein